MANAAVITVSDRVAAGVAEDRGGPAVASLLSGDGYAVAETVVVPDDTDAIAAALVRLSQTVDLVVTTGGTGVSPRDRTPEATASVADYQVPGLAEEMRRVGRETTPMAVLSRGTAAVRGRSLILNLPGSPAGATESLGAVLPVLRHALEQLAGGDHDAPTSAGDQP